MNEEKAKYCFSFRALAMSTSQATDWVNEDKRRMLHVVYRVGDMDATIDYYKRWLHHSRQYLPYNAQSSWCCARIATHMLQSTGGFFVYLLSRPSCLLFFILRKILA